jgi:MFS family permease
MGNSGVLMALIGTGLFPYLLNWLIPQIGWRMTYAVLGVALLLIMVPVGLLFYRSRPETFGLLPDGATTAPKIVTSKGEVEEENWTAQEASRTPAFWIIAFGLASMSMLSTGLMFHMVSIFTDNQMSASAAATVYILNCDHNGCCHAGQWNFGRPDACTLSAHGGTAVAGRGLMDGPESCQRGDSTGLWHRIGQS